MNDTILVGRILTQAAAFMPIQVQTMVMKNVFVARDVHFGGHGKISGTVFTKGTPNTPASRRVRLLREKDGKIIREQWSDAVTGAYSFENVDESITYVIIAVDHEQVFRAEAADNITPTVP